MAAGKLKNLNLAFICQHCGQKTPYDATMVYKMLKDKKNGVNSLVANVEMEQKPQ